MKSIKKQYAWGVLAILVGVLLAGSAAIAPAQAQSTTDLQLMINQLLARINALESGLTTVDGVSSSTVCPYNWTRSLGQGARGSDVQQLQRFLNNDPDTRVAQTGAGSIGQETQYYGPLTAAAVSRFQLKYRNEVLTPLGLVNPTGYFGPSSRAKANALCVSAPAPVPDDEDEDEEEEDKRELRGGEATLDSFDARSGDDTSLEEGQNNAPVMDVRFDVDNGDIRVSRIDVAVTPDGGNDEDDPWDAFDEISIWVDGKKIAEKSVDRRSDWSRDVPNNGDYRARIAGLDWVVRDGERAEFTVALSVSGGVVDTGSTDRWDMFIPDQGIRAVDAAGVNQYTGDTSDTVSFTISEEGVDDELDIRTSSNNPDATTIEVKNNSRSGWETIFVFDLDSGDSINDIRVETAVVNVTVSGDVYNDVINNARLVIDGQTYDDFTVSGGGTATATLTFDIDLDAEIDAGDRVEAEFQVRFNGLTGNYAEGQTVRANTTGSGWEAEGVDDITVGGSATGKIHTLRSEGIIAQPGNTSTDTQGSNDTIGVFKIQFEVTAFSDDFYIAENATTSSSMTDGGVKFSVNGPATPASVSGALDSTADVVSGGVFVVREGQTERFTLTVTVDASVAGLHRVALDDIWFTSNSDGVSSLRTDPANPSANYRTSYVNILN